MTTFVSEREPGRYSDHEWMFYLESRIRNLEYNLRKLELKISANLEDDGRITNFLQTTSPSPTIK
jgi:hypothetical protein